MVHKPVSMVLEQFSESREEIVDLPAGRQVAGEQL
jgi:hypothetical protein